MFHDFMLILPPVGSRLLPETESAWQWEDTHGPKPVLLSFLFSRFFWPKCGTRNCRCLYPPCVCLKPTVALQMYVLVPGFNENPPVSNLQEVMNQLVELRHEAIHDHW